MHKVKSSNIGQNIMSFRGLQLIKDRRKPFISLSSIRNLTEISGEDLKIALMASEVREHRIFVSWGNRSFKTTCIRLKDLSALNEKLSSKVSQELVEEISTEYRNLI